MSLADSKVEKAPEWTYLFAPKHKDKEMPLMIFFDTREQGDGYIRNALGNNYSLVRIRVKQ